MGPSSLTAIDVMAGLVTSWRARSWTAVGAVVGAVHIGAGGTGEGANDAIGRTAETDGGVRSGSPTAVLRSLNRGTEGVARWRRSLPQGALLHLDSVYPLDVLPSRHGRRRPGRFAYGRRLDVNEGSCRISFAEHSKVTARLSMRSRIAIPATFDGL